MSAINSSTGSKDRHLPNRSRDPKQRMDPSSTPNSSTGTPLLDPDLRLLRTESQNPGDGIHRHENPGRLRQPGNRDRTRRRAERRANRGRANADAPEAPANGSTSETSTNGSTSET